MKRELEGRSVPSSADKRLDPSISIAIHFLSDRSLCASIEEKTFAIRRGMESFQPIAQVEVALIPGAKLLD